MAGKGTIVTDDSAIHSNPGNSYQDAIASGIPSTAVLYNETFDNSVRKETFYKELDRIPVTIYDTDKFSSKYLRITYLPDEFKLGKNLIRIRPDIPLFVEDSQLHIEIIDYNGDPIYYETELNSETNDTFIIISVYIYPETPPGPCAIYILGTLKNVIIPEQNQIYPVNFRWAQIINVDTVESTTSPIIFTTDPKVSVLASTASYDILTYAGGVSFTSSIFYNIQLNNGILDPNITTLDSNISFNSAMANGTLYARYEDTNLISPKGFTSTYLLGGGVTSSIRTFITSKSLKLNEPIVAYQQNSSETLVFDSAIFLTASIAYNQDPNGVVPTNFKKRILNISFSDLDSFTGQIRTIKTFYRDTALKTTEYLILNEFELPRTDVYEGFNPNTASFKLLLPDSEQDEYYDVRFEFYNNVNIPSKQVLDINSILVQGTPDVVVNNNGTLMVDPINSTIDGKNITRTLYQDYDTHVLYTSSLRMPTGSNFPITDLYKYDFQKSLAQFTAYIPAGSPYITLYYNTAIINLTQKTLPEDLGYYNYNVMLSVHEMSTSSYTNFTYSNDSISYPKVLESTSSITMYSGNSANQTAFGYPVRHTVLLPQTDKLYRFSLSHNINVTGSLSNSASFDVSCSIKDIEVLSSGYLFISGSRPTSIAGAYTYNVPSVI